MTRKGDIEDDAELVQSIIALPHALKLRVVAEGVENEAQRLTGLNCNQVLGYLLG